MSKTVVRSTGAAVFRTETVVAGRRGVSEVDVGREVVTAASLAGGYPSGVHGLWRIGYKLVTLAEAHSALWNSGARGLPRRLHARAASADALAQDPRPRRRPRLLRDHRRGDLGGRALDRGHRLQDRPGRLAGDP